MFEQMKVIQKVMIAVFFIVFLLPGTAFAHGDGIYGVSWIVIGAIQILVMLKMLGGRKLSGHCVAAHASYLFGIGLIWLLVLYGFQAEPRFNLELQSQFNQMGFGKGETISNQSRFFEQLVGTQYSYYVLIMFLIGLPLASPFLIAWAIQKLLGEERCQEPF